MFNVIKKDLLRYSKHNRLLNIYKYYLTNRGFKAVVLFRISNYFYKKNIKILAMYFQHKNIKINGCEIGFETEIDAGFKIRHPVGIVISGNSRIGENFTIAQNVTIGEKNDGAPIIYENCDIGAGAVLLGNIIISNNTIVGANSVVTKSTFSNSIIVGIPGKCINKNIKE